MREVEDDAMWVQKTVQIRGTGTVIGFQRGDGAVLCLGYIEGREQWFIHSDDFMEVQRVFAPLTNPFQWANAMVPFESRQQLVSKASEWLANCSPDDKQNGSDDLHQFHCDYLGYNGAFNRRNISADDHSGLTRTYQDKMLVLNQNIERWRAEARRA